MKQLKFFLERWGIHSFLLPLFFVLHNYQRYYGLVSADVAIKTLLKILILFLIFTLLVLTFTRNVNKSLQITTLLGAVLLFYGVIKDFFQLTLHLSFVAKYTVLLPLVFVLTIILIRFVLKKKDLKKSNLFQNTLLILFIFIDGATLLADSSFFLNKNLLTKNTNLKLDSLPMPSARPDVYYLVFDCYPGTPFLKDYLGYDNSLFDSILNKKGFHLVKYPKSNYNRTAFSISSTLNFKYFQDIKNFTKATPKDYNRARLTIKESLVPKIFNRHNYKFYNLSIFDIADAPSIYRENFLSLPEENILLYNTLIERLKKDLLWNLISGKHAIGFIQKMFSEKKNEYTFEAKRIFNNTVIDSLQKISLHKTAFPKFIYAHLYLPHPPFFYDENGKQNNIESISSIEAQKNKPLFFSYLKYTNKIILDISTNILQANSKNAVIMIQSDHGFTDFDGVPSDPELFFKNYFALYFPDNDYSAIYDTVSNINTFPILFNKYFNTKIPLQKDTTVFLEN